jgi:hypothetical protein
MFMFLHIHLIQVYIHFNMKFNSPTGRAWISVKLQRVVDTHHLFMTFPTLEWSLVNLFIVVYDFYPEQIAQLSTSPTPIDPSFVYCLAYRMLVQQCEHLWVSFGMDQVNDSLKRLVYKAQPNLEMILKPTAIARNR